MDNSYLALLPPEVRENIIIGGSLDSTEVSCRLPQFLGVCDWSFWARKNRKDYGTPRSYFDLGLERNINGNQRYIEVATMVKIIPESVARIQEGMLLGVYEPIKAFQQAVLEQNFHLADQLVNTVPKDQIEKINDQFLVGITRESRNYLAGKLGLVSPVSAYKTPSTLDNILNSGASLSQYPDLFTTYSRISILISALKTGRADRVNSVIYPEVNQTQGHDLNLALSAAYKGLFPEYISLFEQLGGTITLDKLSRKLYVGSLRHGKPVEYYQIIQHLRETHSTKELLANNYLNQIQNIDTLNYLIPADPDFFAIEIIDVVQATAGNLDILYFILDLVLKNQRISDKSAYLQLLASSLKDYPLSLNVIGSFIENPPGFSSPIYI